MCSDWAVSIRTDCGAIGFDRSTFHYKSRRTDQAAVVKRIREICETRAPQPRTAVARRCSAQQPLPIRGPDLTCKTLTH